MTFTFTFTFTWWLIPTAITALGLIWALFVVNDKRGYMQGISNIFALIPVLIVSVIAWVIAGFLK